MYQRVGTTFGKYQVRRVLGVGGMATVYYALASDATVPIALKILSAQYADIPAFRQRFEFEAHLTALLAHPNIVPVIDYGGVGHELFLAMPFMSGGSLHDRFVLEGAIGLQETARILGQLASALDYAHAQGVIHRDLKLANVLLDEERAANLSDFGIARLAESSLHLTESGSVLGSPHYMSPEQNEGGVLDARSDLYALAVMVYLMITGQFPFHADTALAIALQHLHKTPLPPTAIAPELPPALDAVLMKGLAKLPAHRFDSAASFYNAFQRGLGTFDTQTAIRVAQLSRVPVAIAGAAHYAPVGVSSGALVGDGIPNVSTGIGEPLLPRGNPPPRESMFSPDNPPPTPEPSRPATHEEWVTSVHPRLPHRPRGIPFLIGGVAALGVIGLILFISFAHVLTNVGLGSLINPATADDMPSQRRATFVNAANAPITATPMLNELPYPTNTPNIAIPTFPKFVAISQSLKNPVNVRAGPDKRYAAIFQLRPQDQGVILARTGSAPLWYLISVNGSPDSIGWVLGSVIDVLPTESNADQIPTAATFPAPPTPGNPQTPTVQPRG